MILTVIIKGNHSKNVSFIMPRDLRKRGKSNFGAISHEQVCIENAIDRKGNILIGAVGTGRITTDKIVKFFNSRLGKDITMCTDSHKSYIAVDKELDVRIKQRKIGNLIEF